MTFRSPLETTWEDWLLGGGAARAFADPSSPLVVEIGPGEDDFLLEMARAEPATNWLGIEYSHKRVDRYLRRCESMGVGADNLRLIWRPAADLVEPFLSPAKVARYRLVDPGFARTLAASLVPGGAVVLATDSAAYAAEIHAAFSAAPGMRSVHPDPGWVRVPKGARTTVFEERWRTEGRDIHALRYERVT